MYREGNQENMSFSEENILANSIRIARQKIGKFQQSTKRDSHEKKDDMHNQTFSFSKQKKQNSAAQAIKVLHSRLAQLEAFNATLTKQNSQLKRQQNLKSLQFQSLRSQVSDLQTKNILLKQSNTKLQKNLKHKQKQATDAEMQHKQKQLQYKQQMKTKELALMEQTKEKQMLETKVKQLNKRIDNNQKVIVQMIKQLEEQKQKNRNSIVIGNNFNSPTTVINNESNIYSKSKRQKQYDNFPVIVDEPQLKKQGQSSSNKIKSIRQSTQPHQNIKKSNPKYSNNKKLQKNIETQNKQLQQKNKQLYIMLRNSQRKFRQEQKSKNQYKDRFYNIKNAVDSIIQQINRLPNNLSHKFKCLIVKVKKIENDNLQCLRSYSMLNRNRLHSKSSRNQSSHSKSKSKQKEKKLKMQDLSLSDNNMSQTRSRSKSKRKSLANYLKSHSGKKHQKVQIQSAGQQNQTMRALSKKIRNQRKELCDMYKKVKDETDQQKAAELKAKFEQKMAENVELQSQLQSFKRTKA